MSDSGSTLPLNVLYVEDNEVNAELVQAMAERLGGVRLEVARSGQEALGRLAQRSPDLLLLDMHLGDMDGDEFLARLRASTSRPLPPCVALTADRPQDAQGAAVQSGLLMYLTKPVRMSELGSAFAAVRELRLPALGEAAE